MNADNPERAAATHAAVSSIAPAKLRPRRDDQEFLPAALAILETPASPIGLKLLLALCLFVVLAIVWGWFGKMDIIATSNGKIRPQGGVKVIQPLETGTVAIIDVKDGQHVKAGTTLIQLDQGILQADINAAAASLGAEEAEIARRRAALALVAKVGLGGSFPSALAVKWPQDVPVTDRQREQRVLDNDLHQLAATLAETDGQIAEKTAEQTGLLATMKAEKSLIATLQDRVSMRGVLAKDGSGTKSSLIDAQETLKTQITTLATQRAQMLLSKASAEVLKRNSAKAITSFEADYANKLAGVQKLADDDRQKLAAARLRSQRMVLNSPINGTVLGMSVTTLGQVVMSGQEVMHIVPDHPHLEVESYLPNNDAGFVKVGQKAILKIEAFPFTRYGTLQGTVTHIAHDAIPESQAQQMQANATAAANVSMFPSAHQTQNLVFTVDIKLNQTSIRADGRMVPLTPGMTVTADIDTGKRRILDYFFSPLVEVGSDALKER